MRLPHKEQRGSDAIDIHSFQVTITQIREGEHTYYRATAEPFGKTANAYGQSPDAALTKLYEDVIPRLLGLERRVSSESLFIPRSASFGRRTPSVFGGRR